jgi:inner membrane protein involved in colicin E2 resistance
MLELKPKDPQQPRTSDLMAEEWVEQNFPDNLAPSFRKVLVMAFKAGWNARRAARDYALDD